MTTLAQLLALLPDNTAGEISAADMRNVTTGLWDHLVVDVRDFGALPGSPDATAGLQAAIDSANSRAIWLPNGVYTISGPLFVQDGTTVVGEGPQSVIQLKPADLNVDMIQVKQNAATNVSFRSLTIDGNRDAQPNAGSYTTCFHMQGVTDLVIEDVNVIGSLIDGVYLYQCDNVHLNRVNASDNGFRQADASGMNLDSVTRLRVTHCNTDRNGFHGILLSNTSDAYITGCHAGDNGWNGMQLQWTANGNHIHRCLMENNFRGIYLIHGGCELNHIDHCTVRNSAACGIHFNECWANIATFNHLENNAEYGFKTELSSDYQYGYGNWMRGNGLGAVLFADGTDMYPPNGLWGNI